MDFYNCLQATNWLNNSEEIRLVNGKFVKAEFFDLLSAKLQPTKQSEEIKKIFDFLDRQHIRSAPAKKIFADLSNLLIKNCNSNLITNKIAERFEASIVRKGIKSDYVNTNNLNHLKKWQRNGQPKEIFQKYPEFYGYLEKSGILSQLKITRDTVREIDGNPCLLVEGSWTKLSILQQTFKTVYSSKYQENFLLHNVTGKTYSYLDNGKGLEIHHPYESDLKPISHLHDHEYEELLKEAKLFIRPEDEKLSPHALAKLKKKRTHIIQILTSKFEGSDSNFSNLIARPNHPYLHVIYGADDSKNEVKKGDVFGFGFWGILSTRPLPLVASQGAFRSPDIKEYTNCQEKIVTNIAVTAEEAEKILSYTQKYQNVRNHLNREIGFHILSHNCTIYVKNVLEHIGIIIPTEISLSKLVYRISPEWIKKTFEAISIGMKSLKTGIKRLFSVFPKDNLKSVSSTLKKIGQLAKKIFKCIISLSLVPLSWSVGDSQGEGGIALSSPSRPEARVEPTLSKWQNWFSLQSYKINLPGLIQEWQRKQTSTTIFKDPVRMSVVAKG
jgi:hypothetical protein